MTKFDFKTLGFRGRFVCTKPAVYTNSWILNQD